MARGNQSSCLFAQCEAIRCVRHCDGLTQYPHCTRATTNHCLCSEEFSIPSTSKQVYIIIIHGRNTLTQPFLILFSFHKNIFFEGTFSGDRYLCCAGSN